MHGPLGPLKCIDFGLSLYNYIFYRVAIANHDFICIAMHNKYN